MQPTLVEKAFLLKRNSLFQSLDLDLLLILAEKAEFITAQKGAVLFEFGQETNQMYLIIEGSVEISSTQPLALLFKHAAFGDESLFNQKPHAYRALCMENCSFLVLSRNHILGIVEQSPSFALSLLEIYTKNIDYQKK